MRWVGKRTLKGGRLEIGRVWLTWGGWRVAWPLRVQFRIGRARVFFVGPIAVFVQGDAR
jgi:hypothetical protein